MKTHKYFLSFSAVVFSFCCLNPFIGTCRCDDVSPVENILENGGLEGGVDPDTKLPVGWKVTQVPADAYKVEVVPGGRTGNKCLRISGSGKRLVVLLKSFDLSTDKRFVISGWTKVVAGDGVVSLMHQYRNADGQELSSTSIGGVNSSSLDWTHTAMIDHPEYTQPDADADFIINVGGNVDALIDDLEVFVLRVTPGDLLSAAGDFESHYSQNTPNVLKKSTAKGAGINFALEDQDPANGRYCLKAVTTGDWAAAAMWPVPYDKTNVYTLRGKVRVDSGKASLRIDYYKDDKRKELLGSSTAEFTDSQQWKEISVNSRESLFTGATHITATIICEGETEACFDQLALVAE